MISPRRTLTSHLKIFIRNVSQCSRKERFFAPSRVACNGSRRTHPSLRVFLSFFLFFFSGNYVFPVVARAWTRVACSPMRKLLRIHIPRCTQCTQVETFSICHSTNEDLVDYAPFFSFLSFFFYLRNREKTDILLVKI